MDARPQRRKGAIGNEACCQNYARYVVEAPVPSGEQANDILFEQCDWVLGEECTQLFDFAIDL